ncbi:MAG: hypothetical protein FJ288_14665 [Planctomycetes bacterium]|nr:hypothetical protein [Planctomycetota bacterium]
MSRRIAEDAGPGVPIWVLSFGDMITNLLAFFILLQSFSHAQRAELLQVGHETSSSVMAFLDGLPKWLVGKRPEVKFGFRLRKHTVESDPQNAAPERIIDAEDEQLRKLFDDLRRALGPETSDLRRGKVRIVAAPPVFGPGAATLGPEGRDFLATLASDLPQDPAAPHLDVYAIGLADDAADRPQQFTLSAMRALAAAEALQACMPGELRSAGTRVFSWGIGSGREGPRGLSGPSAAQVVIAVVESEAKE